MTVSLENCGSIEAAVGHSCIARLTLKLTSIMPTSEMYFDGVWVGMQL